MLARLLGLEVGDQQRIDWADPWPSTYNVVVTKVAPGSIGEASGVKPGDVVRRWNDFPVESAADFETHVRMTPPGAVVPMYILRKSELPRPVIVQVLVPPEATYKHDQQRTPSPTRAYGEVSPRPSPHTPVMYSPTRTIVRPIDTSGILSSGGAPIRSPSPHAHAGEGTGQRSTLRSSPVRDPADTLLSSEDWRRAMAQAPQAEPQQPHIIKARMETDYPWSPRRKPRETSPERSHSAERHRKERSPTKKKKHRDKDRSGTPRHHTSSPDRHHRSSPHRLSQQPPAYSKEAPAAPPHGTGSGASSPPNVYPKKYTSLAFVSQSKVEAWLSGLGPVDADNSSPPPPPIPPGAKVEQAFIPILVQKDAPALQQTAPVHSQHTPRQSHQPHPPPSAYPRQPSPNKPYLYHSPPHPTPPPAPDAFQSDPRGPSPPTAALPPPSPQSALLKAAVPQSEDAKDDDNVYPELDELRDQYQDLQKKVKNIQGALDERAVSPHSQPPESIAFSENLERHQSELDSHERRIQTLEGYLRDASPTSQAPTQEDLSKIQQGIGEIKDKLDEQSDRGFKDDPSKSKLDEHERRISHLEDLLRDKSAAADADAATIAKIRAELQQAKRDLEAEKQKVSRQTDEIDDLTRSVQAEKERANAEAEKIAELLQRTDVAKEEVTKEKARATAEAQRADKCEAHAAAESSRAEECSAKAKAQADRLEVLEAELAKAKTEVDEKDAQAKHLGAQADRVDELHAQLEMANKEKNDALAKGRGMEDDVESLKEQLKQLEKQHDTERDREAKLIEQLEKARDQMEKEKDAAVAKVAAVADLEKQLATAQAELADLQKKVDQEKAEKEHEREKCTQDALIYQGKIGDLEDTLNIERQENDQAKEALGKKIGELEVDLASANAKADAEVEKAERAARDKDEAVTKLNDIDKHNKQLDERIKAMEGVLEKEIKEKVVAEEEADKAKQELEGQKARAKAQVDAVEELRKQLDQQIQDLTGQITDNETARKELTAERDDLKKSKAAVDDELTEQQKRVKEQADRIAELLEQARRHSEDMDSQHDELQNARQLASDNADAVVDLEQMLQQSARDKHEQTRQLKEKDDDHQKSTTKLIALQKDCDTASAKLKDTQKEVQKAATELKDATDKVAQLNKELDNERRAHQATGGALASAETSLSAKNKEIDRLRKRSEKMDEVLKELKRQQQIISEYSQRILELQHLLEKDRESANSSADDSTSHEPPVRERSHSHTFDVERQKLTETITHQQATIESLDKQLQGEIDSKVRAEHDAQLAAEQLLELTNLTENNALQIQALLQDADSTTRKIEELKLLAVRMKEEQNRQLMDYIRDVEELRTHLNESNESYRSSAGSRASDGASGSSESPENHEKIVAALHDELERERAQRSTQQSLLEEYMKQLDELKSERDTRRSTTASAGDNTHITEIEEQLEQEKQKNAILTQESATLHEEAKQALEAQQQKVREMATAMEQAKQEQTAEKELAEKLFGQLGTAQATVGSQASTIANLEQELAETKAASTVPTALPTTISTTTVSSTSPLPATAPSPATASSVQDEAAATQLAPVPSIPNKATTDEEPPPNIPSTAGTGQEEKTVVAIPPKQQAQEGDDEEYERKPKKPIKRRKPKVADDELEATETPAGESESAQPQPPPTAVATPLPPKKSDAETTQKGEAAATALPQATSPEEPKGAEEDEEEEQHRKPKKPVKRRKPTKGDDDDNVAPGGDDPSPPPAVPPTKKEEEQWEEGEASVVESSDSKPQQWFKEDPEAKKVEFGALHPDVLAAQRRKAEQQSESQQIIWDDDDDDDDDEAAPAAATKAAQPAPVEPQATASGEPDGEESAGLKDCFDQLVESSKTVQTSVDKLKSLVTSEDCGALTTAVGQLSLALMATKEAVDEATLPSGKELPDGVGTAVINTLKELSQLQELLGDGETDPDLIEGMVDAIGDYNGALQTASTECKALMQAEL